MPRLTNDDQEAIRYLLDRRPDYLDEKEIDFLHGLRLRGWKSARQGAWLDRIFQEVVAGREVRR